MDIERERDSEYTVTCETLLTLRERETLNTVSLVRLY